jgi:hypothetical protein
MGVPDAQDIICHPAANYDFRYSATADANDIVPPIVINTELQGGV